MKDNREALKSGIKIRTDAVRWYEVINEVGRGASCIVYDAYYHDSMKMVHRVRLRECYPYGVDLNRDSSRGLWSENSTEEKHFLLEKERFLKTYKKSIEIRNTLGLVNSTVASVDVFEHGNTLYSVMPMDEGAVYSEYRDGSLKELLGHIKSLVRLIRCYHANGYLHLDLRPENILILPETEEMLFLLDHESLMRIEEVKGIRRGETMFSEGYSAAELMQGRVDRIGLHTDIYSIGAILFAKLFGRLPSLEDCRISAFYDYKEMLYQDERYQPVFYRKLTSVLHNSLSLSCVSRWSDADRFLDAIEELIPLSDVSQVRIRDNFHYDRTGFVGRKQELADIRKQLSMYDTVFMCGIGGIGKTELVKRYVFEEREKYDTVCILYFYRSICSTICDGLHIYGLDREKDETDRDLFIRKLDVLRKILSENDLIILDGFDVEDDGDLPIFLELPGKRIITSRVDYSDYDLPTIRVGKLKDMSDVKALFQAGNDRDYTPKEWKHVENLYEHLEYHTMTMALVAKYLRESGVTPWELYKAYTDTNGVMGEKGTIVRHRKDRTLISGEISDHIRILFKLSSFDDKEKGILGGLSLFGNERIRVKELEKIFNGSFDRAIMEQLYHRGWLGYDSIDEEVFLHPLVSDLLYAEMNPTAEHCSELCRGMDAWLSEQNVDYFEMERREILLERFMERLRGDDLYFARLSVRLLKISGMKLGYRDWKERIDCILAICDRQGEIEAVTLEHDLLRMEIERKIKEVSDTVLFEQDRKGAFATQGKEIAELIARTTECSRRCIKDAIGLAREYIDMAWNIAYILDAGMVLLTTEELDPGMNCIYGALKNTLDAAEKLLFEKNTEAAEQSKLAEELSAFFGSEPRAASRQRYTLDPERVERIREKQKALLMRQA